MTNSWARKSMAVAGIAAGIVLMSGGMAQAASSEAGGVPEGGQYSGNICGNTIADDSIVIVFSDCDSTNVDYDSGWGHHW